MPQPGGDAQKDGSMNTIKYGRLGESLPTYSLAQFETEIESFKPRIFDLYVLPGFIMYYAYKSKAMGKSARRMLFIAGLYMAYRNYDSYKQLVASITSITKSGAPNA